MNERPREVLVSVVAKYGTGVFDDPRRLEALLRDLCPTFRREIFAITQAVHAGVPQELRDGCSHENSNSIINRSAKKLSSSLGLTFSVAVWAVESIAFSLKLVLRNDLRFVFNCPECESPIHAPTTFAGKRVRCPKCKIELTVPENRLDGEGILKKKPAPRAATKGTSTASTVDQYKAFPIDKLQVPQPIPPGPLYYIQEDSNVHGPFSGVQIAALPPAKNRLIWREGFATWVRPQEIWELQPVANGVARVSSNVVPAEDTLPTPVAQSGTIPFESEIPWAEVVTAATDNTSPPHVKQVVKRHRGQEISILGILGIVLCMIPLGPVAIYMAVRDLGAMRRGEMDSSGLFATQAGVALGMVGTILFLYWLLILMGLTFTP